MALSDPSNVTVGEARKRALLAKLAQQMAGKARASGNFRAALARNPFASVAGAGRSIGNSVDLRATGAPRLALPFDIPVNRVRPSGYDRGASGAGYTGGDASLQPVLPSGPPALGGGQPVANDPGAGASQPDLASTLFTYQGTGMPTPPVTLPSQSDVPLQDSGGGAFGSATPPDPYQVMMARISQLREQRLQAATGGF